MSKVDFYIWCEKHRAIIEEINSSGETPSIDRINSDGNYEISNLRIISLKENLSLTKKHTKPIVGVKDNLKIIIKGCWSKGLIKLGCDPSSVQKICKKIPGKGSYYLGWLWRYATREEINLLGKREMLYI